MKNLPVKKEIGDRSTGFGELGNPGEFVRNAGEGVQFGGNPRVAKALQQTMAVFGGIVKSASPWKIAVGGYPSWICVSVLVALTAASSLPGGITSREISGAAYDAMQ